MMEKRREREREGAELGCLVLDFPDGRSAGAYER